MERGRDREEVARRIEAVLREHGGDAGEAGGEVLDVAGVEPRAAGGIRRGDGAGDDVARSQLAAGIGIERESVPVAVHQHGARAAHGLGDERSGVDAGQLERGGMELEELDVAELARRPGAPAPIRPRWPPADWW